MFDCHLIRVVDGDTLILTINLGIVIPSPDCDLAMGLAIKDSSLWAVKERVRLVKVNAPELPTPEGQVSKEYLTSLCVNAPLKVVTYKRERYGRLLADVFNSKGESLSLLMLEAKKAASY